MSSLPSPLPADPTAASSLNAPSAGGPGDSKAVLAAYRASADDDLASAGDPADPSAPAPSFAQWLQAGAAAPASSPNGARAKTNRLPAHAGEWSARIENPAARAAAAPAPTPKIAGEGPAAIKRLSVSSNAAPNPIAGPVLAATLPAAVGLPAIAFSNPGLPGRASRPAESGPDSGNVSEADGSAGGGKKRLSANGTSSAAAGVKPSGSPAGSTATAAAAEREPAVDASPSASETAAASGAVATGRERAETADAASSVSAKPIVRPEGSPGGGWGEKIAAGPGAPSSAQTSGDSSGDKNALTSKDKQDANQVGGVGMAGAKSPSTMSAPAFAHAHFAELNPSIGVSAPATAALNVRTANAPSPAAASTAGDAVNAVIKLADAQALQAGSGVQSVNLGFKFGDSSLGVRVEMRGGEVHTQFNTDSPELRSALASQWQTLAADTSNRPYHFSDPVFASASGGSDLSSETGGGAARQDDAATAASSRASRSLTSLAPSTPPPPDAASAARPAASVLTSRHLHTFA